MNFRTAVRSIYALILCGLAGSAYSSLPVTQNMVMHLDGEHISTSSGYVTSMNDQSGKGNNAVGESALPTVAADAANGYDAVNFAGGAMLNVSSSSDFEFDQCTIFMVCKYPENPDLRYANYLMSICYDLPDVNGQSFQYVYNNHGAFVIEKTILLWSYDDNLRATAYNKTAASYTEGIMPYQGFKGWNLIVMTIDTAQTDAATLEGNVDIFLNPFTTAYPTLAANKEIRHWQQTDSSGGAYNFDNHIMCVLGGKVDFEGNVGDAYPGTYTLTADEAFKGMIAEVAVYSKALSASEIQSVSTYLNQKYNCGTGGELADLPTFYDCRYYQDTQRNYSTDFNDDCVVNFEDYALLAGKWLSEY